MLLGVMMLTLSVQAGPDGAEAIFKRMEQPILKAKTFAAEFEVSMSLDKDSKLKGRLLVAQGNKMRLEMDGNIKGKPGKMTMLSDGVRMLMAADGKPGMVQDASKHLTEVSLAAAARAGIFPALLVVDRAEAGKAPEAFDLEKRFAISDLKLGKKEVVTGKEAQVVDYKLNLALGGKEPMAVTLWIDVTTNLPLKRVVAFKEGAETIMITETYSRAAVDAKIDDKEFQLPR